MLAEKLAGLAAEFADVADPQERLSLVIDRARRIPPLPAGDRTDAARVAGCLSPVWLLGRCREGKCEFRGDAQGPVVRGLVLFLCRFYDGGTAEEIVALEANPLEAVGIWSHLSPTRRNGLAATREAILRIARGPDARR